MLESSQKNLKMHRVRSMTYYVRGLNVQRSEGRKIYAFYYRDVDDGVDRTSLYIAEGSGGLLWHGSSPTVSLRPSILSTEKYDEMLAAAWGECEDATFDIFPLDLTRETTVVRLDVSLVGPSARLLLLSMHCSNVDANRWHGFFEMLWGRSRNAAAQNVELHSCRVQITDLSRRLEESVKLRLVSEVAILQSASELLNAKKEKIRSLTEQLQAAAPPPQTSVQQDHSFSSKSDEESELRAPSMEALMKLVDT